MRRHILKVEMISREQANFRTPRWSRRSSDLEHDRAGSSAAAGAVVDEPPDPVVQVLLQQLDLADSVGNRSSMISTTSLLTSSRSASCSPKPAATSSGLTTTSPLLEVRVTTTIQYPHPRPCGADRAVQRLRRRPRRARSTQRDAGLDLVDDARAIGRQLDHRSVPGNQDRFFGNPGLQPQPGVGACIRNSPCTGIKVFGLSSASIVRNSSAQA